MEIEFDLPKDAINQRHHGLSLAAAGLMDFGSALLKIDDRKPMAKPATSHTGRLVRDCIAWYSPFAAKRYGQSACVKPTPERCETMNRKSDLIMPTPAEDAAIARGIAADPDVVSLPTGQIKRMRAAREVLEQVVGKEKADALVKRRGRPAKPADERKVNQTLRIDPDVLEAYKATGSGWQTLMNDALRDYAKSHRMLPRR